MTSRSYDRSAHAMRPLTLESQNDTYAEGDVIINFGRTRVLCTATLEENVPPFLRGGEQGWVTAEYNMLPRATHTRNRRQTTASSGRTLEIQRLIGRSLRAITDLHALGKRQILLDCDVLLADGGTRQASISGAFVALHQTLHRLVSTGLIPSSPLTHQIAAVSVGLVDNKLLVDLDYSEDSRADTDATLVLTREGDLVEFQLSAESKPLPHDQFLRFYDLAKNAIQDVFAAQDQIIKPLS